MRPMCARIRWHERCVPQHLREIPAGGRWLCPEHAPAAAEPAAPAACVPVEAAPVPTLASEGLTGSEIKSKLEALGCTVHVADPSAPANRKKLADRLDAVPSCRVCSNPLPCQVNRVAGTLSVTGRMKMAMSAMPGTTTDACLQRKTRS